MKLVVPQFHNITRSFSKKLMMERVNGVKYESEDFFSSHNEAIPEEEASKPRVLEISQRLYELAKQDVEKAIEDRINELRGASGAVPKVSGADLDGIKDILGQLEVAQNKDALQLCIEAIKARTDLNETQKEYLRSAVRKLDAKLK